MARGAIFEADERRIGARGVHASRVPLCSGAGRERESRGESATPLSDTPPAFMLSSRERKRGLDGASSAIAGRDRTLRLTARGAAPAPNHRQHAAPATCATRSRCPRRGRARVVSTRSSSTTSTTARWCIAWQRLLHRGGVPDVHRRPVGELRWAPTAAARRACGAALLLVPLRVGGQAAQRRGAFPTARGALFPPTSSRGCRRSRGSSSASTATSTTRTTSTSAT